MQRLIFLSLFLFVVNFLSAQNNEVRPLDSFDEIKVGQSIDVILIEGSAEQAEVSVRGADLEDVITRVSGDRLKIEMAPGKNYWNVDVKVIVTYKELEEISASSSSDVESEGVISADELRVDVSSSADVSISIDTKMLDVEVSSSGDLEIEGVTQEQYVRVSSSGDYDGFDLESEMAEVRVSSSGDVKVNVTKRIDATASSSGTVLYKGNPEKEYVDTSSSGRVRKS